MVLGLTSWLTPPSSAAPSIAMAKMANAFVASMTMAAVAEVGICADYSIGAPNGSWDLQTKFSNWVSSKEFLPSGNLIFVYGPTHSVLEVTKGDYDTCTTTNPLSSDSSGNTSIALTAPGTRYFICGTPMHCPSGMKIEILVSSPSSSPPVATPPPPQKSEASTYDLRVQIAVASRLGLAVLMLVAL